jgi:4-azaleucine resistance transporter AzlC
LKSASYSKQFSDHFIAGLKAGVPVGIGYVPIAVAFGLMAANAGLSPGEIILMSIVVFAGASQFIAVQMLAAGASLLGIVITVFIVNLRHLLMSASLSLRIKEASALTLALLSFGITDESFAVASLDKRSKLPVSFLCGLNLLGYASWVGGTVIGTMTGALLPEFVQQSMGVALYAMFIGLLIPASRTSIKVATVAVTGAVLNWFFQYGLEQGWALIMAALAGAAVGAFLSEDEFTKEENKPVEEALS